MRPNDNKGTNDGVTFEGVEEIENLRQVLLYGREHGINDGYAQAVLDHMPEPEALERQALVGIPKEIRADRFAAQGVRRTLDYAISQKDHLSPSRIAAIFLLKAWPE